MDGTWYDSCEEGENRGTKIVLEAETWKYHKGSEVTARCLLRWMRGNV